MQYTLLFNVVKDSVSVGNIFVTNCPDLKLADKLLNFGGEGYKFLNIVQCIFEKFDDIEFLTYSECSSIPHYNDKTCIISWNMVQ